MVVSRRSRSEAPPGTAESPSANHYASRFPTPFSSSRPIHELPLPLPCLLQATPGSAPKPSAGASKVPAASTPPTASAAPVPPQAAVTGKAIPTPLKEAAKPSVAAAQAAIAPPAKPAAEQLAAAPAARVAAVAKVAAAPVKPAAKPAATKAPAAAAVAKAPAAKAAPAAAKAPAAKAAPAAPKKPVTIGKPAVARVPVPASPQQGAPLPVGVVPVPKTVAPLNLCFVSSEVAPWSKTGGLGDVVGALPAELARRGHRVMTVAPRYDQYHDAWDTSVVVDVLGEQVRFFHSVDQGVDRVWVDHPLFLAKVDGPTGSMIYGKKSGADYSDNAKRFRVFCEAAIEAARALPFGGAASGGDVTFVANDWHAALVPVLLKKVYQARGEFTGSKSVLCCHNIAFQGRFWAKDWDQLALPASAKADFEMMDGSPIVYDETVPEALLENPPVAAPGQKFAKLNWLRAGFLSADKCLTVSPNYAAEVSSGPAMGVELDDVLRTVGIEGITNGMDVSEWHPSIDKFVPLPYDRTTVVAGKAAAKAELQAECGLDVDPTVPVFGFIGRLEEQKGVDILVAAVPGIAAAGGQVVVLGTGKKVFEAAVKQLEDLAPGCKGVVKFSAPHAHLITAGADFMLVPSRFEPCGLIQMHAMQYGTVPVVASTGGLVDTVADGVTGFHIGALDADGLVDSDVDAVVDTCARAIAAHKAGLFAKMSQACIDQDLTWAEPAKKWEAILEQVSTGKDTSAAAASVVDLAKTAVLA